MLELLKAWAHAWRVMVSDAIAHRVAGKQLAELERYRQASRLAQRWLANYPQADLAVNFVQNAAEGRVSLAGIGAVREEIERHAGEKRGADVGLGHDFTRMREALAEHNRMLDARQHHHQLPAQRRRRDDGPMVKQ